jgi:SNF2 family DNA or RNA helicase
MARTARPVPVLRLMRAERGRLHGVPKVVDSALLAFDYGGVKVGAAEPPAAVRLASPARPQRDPDAEQSAVDLLQRLGLFPDEAAADGFYWPRQKRDWIALQAGAFPVLERRGWRIEIDEDFSNRLLSAGDWEAHWRWAGAQASSDRRALDVQVEAGGRRRRLLPLLQAFLTDPEEQWSPGRFLALDDETPIILRDPEIGDWISLPAGLLKPLVQKLIELFDPKAAFDAEGGLEMPAAVSGVLDLGASDVEPLRPPWPVADLPRGLRAELRGYQRSGLSWLQALRARGLGGILADDMGLGKTLQALAHLLLEREQGRLDHPALVIAPTSLMFNWAAEAQRFAPELRVVLFHGPQRRADFAGADLVLTTYPLLLRELERLQRQPWHLLFLDEAQTLKNRHSQAAQAVVQLQARQRICLTGTPMENHLGEFWTLMQIAQPGWLGDENTFNRRYRFPIEKEGDRVTEAALRERVAPFLLRRTKALVAPELPPRTEILRSVPLEGEQRALYETVRLAMDARVRQALAEKGWGGSRIMVLDALLKLRQVCCDPSLVKLDAAQSVQGSAKLDLLMELLDGLMAEGRKVLLFSQFTEMLDRIETRLSAASLRWVRLTGETRDREKVVRRFQSGEVPLFLISLKAGGVGLNLTAADTVIHYDPWWNPAAEQQATDRAHRIGQTQPVFVYKLLTEGTVEEKIAELQARKRALADALLGDAATTSETLTPELLKELLAPLAGQAASSAPETASTQAALPF